MIRKTDHSATLGGSSRMIIAEGENPKCQNARFNPHAGSWNSRNEHGSLGLTINQLPW